MWLPVVNCQFEVCLIYFYDFAVLHYASALAYTMSDLT